MSVERQSGGAPQTLFAKIWGAHAVAQLPDEEWLLSIDLHLLTEITSPQAFDGLRESGRTVRHPDRALAVADHNVPTSSRLLPIADPDSSAQIRALEGNAAEFGIPYIPLTSRNHGIVHIIGPELGLMWPGTTIVCGDSHTSTHGAFGALAFGIGTSEVEHVLATQTLVQKPARTMLVRVDGALRPGVTAKDLALAITGAVGTAGATGHVIEYAGEAVRALDMAGRMTVCNMSIEMGARAGLIAPDETTLSYLRGRAMAPGDNVFDDVAARWLEVRSDKGAVFDRVVDIDASAVEPLVTWGTSPETVTPIDGLLPDPAREGDPARARQLRRALDYMGLGPGQTLRDLPIDVVFIGSCTNSRIEDLREAAAVARRGRGGAPPPARGGAAHAGDGRAGLGQREGRGGARRPRPHLPRRGVRMAGSRVLAVRRHEPGPPRARPTLRVHLQPQLRTSPGAWGAHAPDVAGHGGGGRDRRRAHRRGSSDGRGALVQPLTILEGVAAALPMANVDTDMILAAEFMKTTSRRGLGAHLLDALRRGPQGERRTDFVLEQAPWTRARFLIALENFGCGSSREHAPWALGDFGIRCIVAPSFADIFASNCTKNGMLPLVLDRNRCEALIADACDPATAMLRLDLPRQVLVRSNGERVRFDVAPERKRRLVEGLDDIAQSLAYKDAIERHEARIGYPRPRVPADLGRRLPG